MIKGSQTTITAQDFAALPSHSRQRNIERHSRKIKKFVEAGGETLNDVATIKFNGTTYKLNGHTRAYLWGRGIGKPAAVLRCTVYECSTEEEYNSAYLQFDNSTAAEGVTDKMSGAANCSSLDLKSGLFNPTIPKQLLEQAYPWQALKTGGVNVDEFDLVAFFADTLKMIDVELEPTTSAFKSGVGPALIMTAYLHGKAAIPFWREYMDRKGGKIGDQQAPSLSLVRLMDIRTAKSSLYGRTNRLEIRDKALGAYRRQRRGLKLYERLGLRGSRDLCEDLLDEMKIKSEAQPKVRLIKS